MSKFNVTVSPDDGFFIINEEKHTIVWVLENTAFTFVDLVRNSSHISPECDDDYNYYNHNCRNMKSSFFYRLLMPNKFVGVAKCNVEEGDVWDVETGKLIAFTKGKDAFCKSFVKRANYYINTLDEWVTDSYMLLDTITRNMETNAVKRHERVKERLGGYLRTAPQS